MFYCIIILWISKIMTAVDTCGGGGGGGQEIRYRNVTHYVDREILVKLSDRHNLSGFDNWDEKELLTIMGMSEEKFWQQKGGPGQEIVPDDGTGTGWGYGPQPRTDENGNVLPTDQYGNVILTDKYGNFLPTDHYGNRIITDRYGNRLYPNKDGRYVLTDEYGNEMETNKFGLPVKGYGSGWPPGWEMGDDADAQFPFIGGPPPPYAIIPTGISTGVAEFCFQPLEIGPCEMKLKRYAFNRFVNKCLAVTYSGCGGNQNNFVTEADCINACINGPRENECDADGKLDVESLAVD